jgi:hypothetical protein
VAHVADDEQRPFVADQVERVGHGAWERRNPLDFSAFLHSSRDPLASYLQIASLLCYILL